MVNFPFIFEKRLCPKLFPEPPNQGGLMGTPIFPKFPRFLAT